MSVAFAICFFLLVGLGETLRQGVFGLNPAETTAISYAALVFAAILILRSDVMYLLRRPVRGLYGSKYARWSWPRSVLGVVLAPLVVVIPLAYWLSQDGLMIAALPLHRFFETAAYQGFVVAFASEVFFREAALKAFQGQLAAVFVASTLAYFIYQLPTGLPAALIGAGLGMFYLALRLIGTNILVVALIHGAVAVAMSLVMAAMPNVAEMWSYAIYFTVVAAILSFTVTYLLVQTRSEIQDA